MMTKIRRVVADRKCVLLVALILFAAVISNMAMQASAPTPSTIQYRSEAKNHISNVITVTDPQKAHDRGAPEQREESFAQFSYNTTGSFEVKDFTIPDSYPQWAPNINQVDLKMKYNTTSSSSDDKYRIVYYVAPSSDFQVLKDYARDTTALDIYTWTNPTEPNDGTWSWADIANLRIVVETLRVGTEDSPGTFQEYQAWVTVVMPSTAKFFVEPASTFALPDEFFKVNITVNNIVDLYSFEFHLNWDPVILNITSAVFGPFVETGAWVWNNQSWWTPPAQRQVGPGELSFAAQTGPLGRLAGEGRSGNGTLLVITFIVQSQARVGTSLSIARESGKMLLIDSSLQNIPADITDGVFGVPTPVARFSYSPQVPLAGGRVDFNASESYHADPSRSIVSYSWNFGDGTTPPSPELDPFINHTYASAGSFTVNLTLTDDIGIAGSTTKILVVAPSGGPKHDVGIKSITANPTTGKPGDTVSVTVVAQNVGSFTENFTVTLSYDSTQIGNPQTVTNLASGNEQSLSFSWNTAGVAAGTYTVKATASQVADEANADLANNSKTVSVTLQGESNLLLYAGIGVAAIVAVIVIIYFVRRRKPKTSYNP